MMTRCWHDLIKGGLAAAVLVFGPALGPLMFADQAHAQPPYCPEKIGYLEKNPLARTVLPQVLEAYEALGCKTAFVGYPSNRVITLFNQRGLDGDLIRGMVAEDHYAETFIKSDTPIYVSSKVLWAAEDAGHTRPTGYLKGVKWHESYVMDQMSLHHRFTGFLDYKAMITAYNRGSIDSFLFLQSPIEKLSDDYFKRERPQIVADLGKLPLYHYLHADFRHFMDDLNGKLAARGKSTASK